MSIEKGYSPASPDGIGNNVDENTASTEVSTARKKSHYEIKTVGGDKVPCTVSLCKMSLASQTVQLRLYRT